MHINVSQAEGSFYLECEVVHMALSCCSEGSSRYIVWAITGCSISNYVIFISDTQHLLRVVK